MRESAKNIEIDSFGCLKEAGGQVILGGAFETNHVLKKTHLAPHRSQEKITNGIMVYKIF